GGRCCSDFASTQSPLSNTLFPLIGLTINYPAADSDISLSCPDRYHSGTHNNLVRNAPMGTISEFKEFAVKGNVVDMAVGIIIGGASGTIVKSLVSDVIMPPIGLLLGGVDFSNLFLTISGDGDYQTIEQAAAEGAVTINYGLFINNLVSFVIVAFAVFLL